MMREGNGGGRRRQVAIPLRRKLGSRGAAEQARGFEDYAGRISAAGVALARGDFFSFLTRMSTNFHE